MKSRIRRVYRRHFLGMDFSLAVFLTCLVILWSYVFNGESIIDDMLQEKRAVIYRTTAMAGISLLGFSLTVTSIVVGFASSERLGILRGSRHYPTLWRTFFQTIYAFGFLSMSAFICLLFDRDDDPIPWLGIPLIFFFILSVLRLHQSIRMLQPLVRIVSGPSLHDTGESDEGQTY